MELIIFIFGVYLTVQICNDILKPERVSRPKRIIDNEKVIRPSYIEIWDGNGFLDTTQCTTCGAYSRYGFRVRHHKTCTPTEVTK